MTLHQRSAAVTITGTVNIAGRVVPLVGSGQADFADGAFTGVITSTIPGLTVKQQFIAVGGHSYMRIGIDGLDIGRLTHGRVWVSMATYPSGNAYTLGDGDPLPQLQLVGTAGNEVRPLGASSIDRVSVTGYSVTIQQSAIVHELRNELAAPGVTSSEAQQIQQALANPGRLSLAVQVWFDHAGLLRRMITRSIWGGTPVNAASLTMTFAKYGTPVNIAAPAPGDVISYADFLRAAKRLRRPPPR